MGLLLGAIKMLLNVCKRKMLRDVDGKKVQKTNEGDAIAVCTCVSCAVYKCV